MHHEALKGDGEICQRKETYWYLKMDSHLHPDPDGTADETAEDAVNTVVAVDRAYPEWRHASVGYSQKVNGSL